MKFLPSQLAYLTTDREARGNLRALAKYLAFLGTLVTIYAILFHVIKLNVEHEEHSWITGFYWTLVVMTTLGFGDVTFTSDVGRLFSIVVLLSGVVFLLVMLPFLFIRLFYAPWLEARVRLRAPREVPVGTHGHVIIVEYDAIAAGLVERLSTEDVPYVVIEPDPAQAGRLMGDGLFVLAGQNDNRLTYERAAAPKARLVLANCEDTTNTNITMTVREIAPTVTIAAIVEEEDAVDVLQLSGATAVLPLKHQLGDYLANRVDVGRPEPHVIGEFRGLQIAELPARDTPFIGRAIRETTLRQQTGLSVVGFWERGKLRPAYPQTEIRSDSVLVVAGTGPQLAALNALLPKREGSFPLVVVVGAGKVGQATARALKRRGLPVHAIDRTDQAASSLDPRSGRRFHWRRGRPATARAGRHPAGALRRAHDQRRRGEHLSGRVLPSPESRPADRQPHHPRTQSRSHSSRGGGFRAELHDARDRGRDVVAARPPTGPSRRGRRALLGESPGLTRRPAAERLRHQARVPVSASSRSSGVTSSPRRSRPKPCSPAAPSSSCWAATNSGRRSRRRSGRR